MYAMALVIVKGTDQRARASPEDNFRSLAMSLGSHPAAISAASMVRAARSEQFLKEGALSMAETFTRRIERINGLFDSGRPNRIADLSKFDRRHMDNLLSAACLHSNPEEVALFLAKALTENRLSPLEGKAFLRYFSHLTDIGVLEKVGDYSQVAHAMNSFASMRDSLFEGVVASLPNEARGALAQRMSALLENILVEAVFSYCYEDKPIAATARENALLFSTVGWGAVSQN